MRRNQLRIGLDFGGVIVTPVEGNVPLRVSCGADIIIPGAFEAVSELVSLSDGNVWIVSKASATTQTATRLWLGQTRFYQQTGFIPANIIFCEKRQDKAAICRSLNLTHFIDDNEEVLFHLSGVVAGLYQFGSQTYPTWCEILFAIRQ